MTPRRRRQAAVVTVLSVTLLLALPLFGSSARGDAAIPAHVQADGIPPIPDSIVEQVSRYTNTRSASLQGWLPSGGMLIATRFGDTSQLHVVERPGGARQQITFYGEPVNSAAVSPDDGAPAFAFVMDEGGSENYQIYLYDLDSRGARRLTDGTSRNGSVVWDREGSKIAYVSNGRNGVDFDVRILDIAGAGSERAIVEDRGYWYPVDFSRDGRRLLVGHYISVTQSEYWVVDLDTDERRPLQQLEKTVGYGPAVFDGEGDGVYFASDQWGEFRYLAHIELDGGAPKVLTSEIPWDVEQLELSSDGKTLAFSVNVDGASQLYLLDTRFGGYRRAELPMGVIRGLHFDASGRNLGFTLTSPTSSGDAYSLAVGPRATARELLRWTHSEVGGLDTESFVEPTLVHYRTFDTRDGIRRTIPAYLYLPEGSAPHPVVISIHGGPEGQARPVFSSSYQYWVKELGLAVLVPNVRGSTGYGRSYTLLDNGGKREDSVKDIGALLDWIAGRSDLDETRVGVVGGSYGGYMVLATLTHYSPRIAAAVEIVGISNFVTFLEHTQEYRRDLRRVEYGDERDPDMRALLESISPLNHAEDIGSPLFVAQGANDPRVPAGEAEQIVRAVRANGKDVWYMLAGDEGHGFRKKPNSDYFRYAVALFWRTHLLGLDAPEVGQRAQPASPDG